MRYDEHARSLFAVQEARLGRIHLLVERLRSGCELFPHERECVADYIEDKWKRPPNSPGKRPDLVMQERVYETYWAARESGDLEKEAVHKAGKPYGIGGTKVRELCRAEKRDRDRRRASFDKMFERLKRNGMSNKS